MKVKHELSESFYGSLPELLKKTCSIADSPGDRDLILISSLGVLSGTLSSCTGIYDRRRVYPNLFLFVVAKAGVGKGVMKYARRLVENKHDQMRLDGKANENNSMLLIPGNISGASLYDILEANHGKGIIFETEADTISVALNQDWGGFSELLRKAFHGETATLSRKGEPKYSEIRTPMFAVVISGTPGQINSLMEGIEDGLFSRFQFLAFDGISEWKDVFAAGANMDDHFANLSKEYDKVIKHAEEFPFQLELSEKQQSLFNIHFARIHDSELTSDEIKASIRRLGVSAFKTCIILTAIRRWEKGYKELSELCEDEDVQISLKLSLFFHFSLYQVLKMTKESRISFNNFTDRKLYNVLPEPGVIISRSEAIGLSSEIGVEEATIDKSLGRLKDQGRLVQPSYGFYMKPVQPTDTE